MKVRCGLPSAHKLTNEGVFEKINDFLRERAREKEGRKKTSYSC